MAAKMARGRAFKRARQPRTKNLFAAATVWKVMLAFAVLVAFTGGGSRDDIVSLVVLRPAAMLFLAYGILASSTQDIRDYAPVIGFLCALAFFFAVQLIPLPPSIWQSLPGRELYAEVARTAEVDNVWRPWTLSPSKTTNSLFALSVPIAAAFLYAALSETDRQKVLYLIVAFAILNAIVGMAQMAGGLGDVFYFYRITSDGNPVGLFANRNHFAVMLAASLPLISALLLRREVLQRLSRFSRDGMVAGQILFVAIMIVFSIMVVISGSRAGVICLAFAVIWSSVILKMGAQPPKSRRNALPAGALAGWASYIWIIPIILTAAAAFFAFVSGRASAIDRLFSDNTNTMRFDALPTVLEMAGAFFPFGSGMGTFANVYRQFEEDELLSPLYLNHAHNDWAQIIVEAGAIGGIVLLIPVVFLLTKFAKVVFQDKQRSKDRQIQLALIGIVLVFMAASLVDYPVRVPSVMWVLTVCFCALLAGTVKQTIGVHDGR